MYLFSDCKSLSTLPDISKWNTNNVTNISYLFSDCKSLSTLPDISK
jgi:surface protein